MKTRRFGPFAGAALLLAAPVLAQTTQPPAQQTPDQPAPPGTDAHPGDPKAQTPDARQGTPGTGSETLPQQPDPQTGKPGDTTQPEKPKPQE